MMSAVEKLEDDFEDDQGLSELKLRQRDDRKYGPDLEPCEDLLLFRIRQNNHKMKVHLETEGQDSESDFNNFKMLVCVTMYNETYSQFLQTMCGVTRAVAELEKINPEKY